MEVKTVHCIQRSGEKRTVSDGTQPYHTPSFHVLGETYVRLKTHTNDNQGAPFKHAASQRSHSRTDISYSPEATADQTASPVANILVEPEARVLDVPSAKADPPGVPPGEGTRGSHQIPVDIVADGGVFSDEGPDRRPIGSQQKSALPGEGQQQSGNQGRQTSIRRQPGAPDICALRNLYQKNSDVIQQNDSCETLPAPSASTLLAACGGRHSALVLPSGRLAIFGHGNQGKLGLGRGAGSYVPNPTAVNFVGERSRCSQQRIKGSLHNVGSPGTNQRGDESRAVGQRVSADGLGVCQVISSPRMTGFRIEICAVSCGDSNTAAIDSSGAVWTWGNGQNGRLGHGDTNPSSFPRKARIQKQDRGHSFAKILHQRRLIAPKKLWH